MLYPVKSPFCHLFLMHFHRQIILPMKLFSRENLFTFCYYICILSTQTFMFISGLLVNVCVTFRLFLLFLATTLHIKVIPPKGRLCSYKLYLHPTSVQIWQKKPPTKQLKKKDQRLKLKTSGSRDLSRTRQPNCYHCPCSS